MEIAMNYTYKFRIYPNERQIVAIQKNFGCCRYVFNYFLDREIKAYKENKKYYTFFENAAELTKLKKELQWLTEADSRSLQISLKNLDNAYQNFFRAKRNGKQANLPNFKEKHEKKDSYTTMCANNSIRVLDNAVKLPKLGIVKCKVSKKVTGNIQRATISQSTSGKYFVSLFCTEANYEKFPSTGKAVGVDIGIKDLVITSDGRRFHSDRYLEAAKKKLAKLQRELSRKTKDSANWEKTRIKIARVYEHIVNQRNDTIHKMTTELVRNYDVLCVEDLDAKKIKRNPGVSKYACEVSFSEIKRQLIYKAAWNNKRIVTVSRWFPSSQTCSECGIQWSGIKDMSVRMWICPNCNAIHDRDVNAAKNILNEGLKSLF